jgi:hypothetical protein
MPHEVSSCAFDIDLKVLRILLLFPELYLKSVINLCLTSAKSKMQFLLAGALPSSDGVISWHFGSSKF